MMGAGNAGQSGWGLRYAFPDSRYGVESTNRYRPLSLVDINADLR
jgi:hypothetical protein